MHLSSVQSVAGTSLTVQWIGFCASTAGSTGLILCQGAKILQIVDLPPKKCGQFNHKVLGSEARSEAASCVLVDKSPNVTKK